MPIRLSEMSAADEAAARRAARRVGLRAVKSRRRRGTSDNRGGFQLLYDNVIVAGVRLELTADDVIELCNKVERGEAPCLWVNEGARSPPMRPAAWMASGNVGARALVRRIGSDVYR